MEKKKMVLCTRIPEKEREKIKQYCDITEAGELLHGKGNSTEETLREECMGKELVVLGDEPAGAETLKAWAPSGMKFLRPLPCPLTPCGSWGSRCPTPPEETPWRWRSIPLA